MKTEFTLVTNLLQTVSLPILEDWVEFFDYPPKTLICYFGYNEDAKAAAEKLCKEHGINLIIAPDELTPNIRKENLPVIRWQFQNAPDEFCVCVSLDTIPYRDGQGGWFNQSLHTLQNEKLIYVTGSTRDYRSDKPHSTEEYALTQKASFNFIIVQPRFWLNLDESYSYLQDRYRRFYVEGILEHYCRERDKYALRLRNRRDWRIFHVQIWDERVLEIRRKFRSGIGVGKYLRGYQDDQIDPWKRYYLFPRPPLIKRVRIELGRLRRRFFDF